MSLANLLGGTSNVPAADEYGSGHGDALDAALSRSENTSSVNHLNPAERLKQYHRQKAIAKAVKPPEAVIEAALLARQKSSRSVDGSRRQHRLDINLAGVDSDYARHSKKRKRDDGTSKNPDSPKILTSSRVTANDEDVGFKGDGDEDDDDDLLHETLRSDHKSRKIIKSKIRDAEPATAKAESVIDRNARTTFVGNVPIACATNKASKKALIRHLIAALHTQPSNYASVIRLESIRFRSLQLAEPITANAGERERSEHAAAVGNETQDNDSGSRSMRRARRWREDDQMGNNTASAGPGQQKFLTASQKRKVAFITGDIHQKATSCNAYAVWRSSDSAVAGAADITRALIAAANNTTFEGHTLRVDAVSPPRRLSTDIDANKDVRASASEKRALLDEEKRTLFLGGLDFEEEEQSIRNLCEQLLSEERGGASTASPSNHGWVDRVRIIKDSTSGLGKGFAYVVFADRECVDTMLAIDAAQVKLSKRKLRMERCRSTRLAAASKRLGQAASSKAVPSKARLRVAEPPSSEVGGHASTAPANMIRRPDVGESLRDLSKDERKALKSTDAERLARRLQKKEQKKISLRTERAKASIDASLRKTAAPKATAPASARKAGAKSAKQVSRQKVTKGNDSRSTKSQFSASS